MTALEYERRRNQHRPQDPSQLVDQIRELHRGGLTARDISNAWRLPLGSVQQAIAFPTTTIENPPLRKSS
jgi:hypothetical protein